MNDLNELLSLVVDDQPPMSITRESSVAAGRRLLRRRRRFAVSTCAGVLVVAGALVATLGPGGGRLTPVGGPGGGPASAAPTGSLSTADPLPTTSGVTMYPLRQLPTAPGVPGALRRPDLVGGDPLVRHFSMDALSGGANNPAYDLGGGSETVRDGLTTVTVSRSKDAARKVAEYKADLPHPTTTTKPMTVEGRPATLYSITGLNAGISISAFGLLWNPVNGLWVGMSVNGEHPTVGELWNDLAALHLDRAQRCGAPFQLTDLPPGAKVLHCTVSYFPLPGRRYGQTNLVVGDGKGDQADVGLGGQSDLDSIPPNRTVDGHAVLWHADKTFKGFVSGDFVDGVPLYVKLEGDYGEAEGTRILTGLKVTGNLEWDSYAVWPAGSPAGH